MCLQELKDQFHLNKFSLSHPNPIIILQSQWECFRPKAYAIYRVALALLFIGFILYDIIADSWKVYGVRFWFIFATNWAVLSLVVAFVILAVLCLIYYKKSDYGDNQHVRGHSIAWFFYVVAVNGNIVASLIFWVALNSPFIQMSSSSTYSKVKHSVIAIIVLMDFFVAGIPVNLYHVVYIMIVGLIYAVFSVIYYACGGINPFHLSPWIDRNEAIYPQLNWKFPSTSVVVVLCAMVACLLVQIILFCFYVIRLKISYLLGGKIASAYYSKDLEKASILKESGDMDYDSVAH